MSLIILLLLSYTSGCLILRTPPGQSRPERAVFRLAMGLCVCAILIICLGSSSLARTHTVMLFLSFGTTIAVIIVASIRRMETSGDEPPRYTFTKFECLCRYVIYLALGIGAISVMAPPTSWDALVAHLALPAQYVRQGYIAADPGNTYTGYPHLLHALYTFAFYGAGEFGVQFLSWLFSGLACMFIFSLGRAMHSRACGMTAAAIFATTPIFFDQTGVPSIDVAVSALVAAALASYLAAFDKADAARRMKFLMFAAFIAGSACGIRHTAYVVCALLTLGLIVQRRPPREVMAFVLLAFAGAAPWLLRSYIAVGNPVYPFCQGIFPSDVLINEDFTSLGQHGSRHGARFHEVFLFPWRIVMRPDLFDGWSASAGCLILTLGVPGVILGGRRERLLGAYFLLGALFFFMFQHLARYMLPFFIAMIPVAASAVFRLEKLRKPIVILLICTFAFGLTLGFAMNHFKISPVLGTVTRERYLARRVERYKAIHQINWEYRDAKKLFSLEPRVYYFDMPVYKNFEMLVPLIGRPIEEQAAWFDEQGIEYLVYPVKYVENSPRFKTSGLLPMFNEWRGKPDFFKPVSTQETETRGVKETVIVYRIQSTGNQDGPNAGQNIQK